MKRVIVITICFALAVFVASAQTRDIGNQENYRIYDAVIVNMFAGDKVTFDTQEKIKHIVIRDLTTTDYASWDKKEDWNEVKIRLPNLSDDTIADYEAKLKTATKLKRSFKLRLEYSLLPKKDYDTIFKNRGYDDLMGCWKLFYERYPESGGYISLSNVGVNKTGKQALVYFVHSCGGLCGTGSYILLKKTDTGWVVDTKARIWIS